MLPICLSPADKGSCEVQSPPFKPPSLPCSFRAISQTQLSTTHNNRLYYGANSVVKETVSENNEASIFLLHEGDRDSDIGVKQNSKTLIGRTGQTITGCL